MVEKVKLRESAPTQPLLMAVSEMRESLISLIEAERNRLRTLMRAGDLSLAEHEISPSAYPPIAPPVTSLLESSSSFSPKPKPRPSVTQERDSQAKIQPEPESKTVAALDVMADQGRRSSSPDNHLGRPENPRKRLDELARLLDKRAKQSAESVLKALEAKEAGH